MDEKQKKKIEQLSQHFNDEIVKLALTIDNEVYQMVEDNLGFFESFFRKKPDSANAIMFYDHLILLFLQQLCNARNVRVATYTKK